MVASWFKGGGSSFHVQLEQANKSFARKAVSQIEAIPELEILISLSDNSLTVHELRSLKPLSGATQSLSNTKGANVFSVDVEVCYYVTFFDGGKERKFMFFDGGMKIGSKIQRCCCDVRGTLKFLFTQIFNLYTGQAKHIDKQ